MHKKMKPPSLKKIKLDKNIKNTKKKYRKAEYVQRCVPSSNVQVLFFEVVLMHDAWSMMHDA